MFFNELRKQGKLANRRHPMYDKNRFARFFMYFGAVFWGGYLVFFGVMMAKALSTASHTEAYHLLNSALVFILTLDFLIRFPFQKTATQEIRPYLLLPVKRRRIIDFLLIRSGLSGFNLIWLFFFVPFALLTVTRFYGITGIITYSIGIWLLMVFNNYWYLICRTLMNERIWWILLPIGVYGLLGAAIFLPDHNAITYFFMNLGEGFIEGNPWAFLGIIVAIAAIGWTDSQVMFRLAYAEMTKQEDIKVKNVSEYKFFDRYGEIGEYLRLELKMLPRNKRCKSSLRTIAIVVLMFSAVLSFSEVYDGVGMTQFIVVYAFSTFGMVSLGSLMGYEGNYLDGLMSRKESIHTLLRAKYYFYSTGTIIPFVLMLPAIIMGKVTLLNAFAMMLFTTGPVYFLLFQMAVYNTKTQPLNEGITGRYQAGSALQTIISLMALGLPMMFFFMFNALFGQTTTFWILLGIGLCFTLTSPWWIRNVYQRFMKRRYTNMEGFRDSR